MQSAKVSTQNSLIHCSYMMLMISFLNTDIQAHKISMGMEICSSFSHPTSSCKQEEEEANRIHLRSTRQATLSPDDRYYKLKQGVEATFLVQREKDTNRKKSALEERRQAMEIERTGLVEKSEVESKLRMRWAESYIHSILQGHREAAEGKLDNLLQPTDKEEH